MIKLKIVRIIFMVLGIIALFLSVFTPLHFWILGGSGMVLIVVSATPMIWKKTGE